MVGINPNQNQGDISFPQLPSGDISFTPASSLEQKSVDNPVFQNKDALSANRIAGQQPAQEPVSIAGLEGFALDVTRYIDENYIDENSAKLPSLQHMLGRDFKDADFNAAYQKFSLLAELSSSYKEAILDNVDEAFTQVNRGVLVGRAINAVDPTKVTRAGKAYDGMTVAGLVYRYPKMTGEVGVFLCKKIMLDNMKKLIAEKRQDGTFNEKEIKTFEDWVDKEQKAVTKGATDLAIKFGKALPSDLSSVLRLCAVDVPIFKLALTWVGCALGPIFAALDLRKAVKEYKEVNREIRSFHEDMFKKAEITFEASVDGENQPVHIRVIDEATERLQEAAKTARDNRQTALLSKANDQEPLGFYHRQFDRAINSAKNQLAQALLQCGKELEESKFNQKRALGAVLDFLSEKGIQVEEGLLHGQEEPLNLLNELLNDPKFVKDCLENYWQSSLGGGVTPRDDLTYSENFERLFQNAINAPGLSATRNFFERAGIPVDHYTDKDLQGRMDAAANGTEDGLTFKKSLLARYIDTHSTQQMSDSARNGLKTIESKRLELNKQGLKGKIAKNAFLLAFSAASSIVVVTLATISGAGAATIPLIAFLAPSLVGLGLTGGFFALGLYMFKRKQPNLFSEYIKGSFIKKGAYSIPKKARELGRSFALWRATASQSKAESEKDEAIKQKALQNAQKWTDRAHVYEEKIDHWKAKIEPIEEDISQAKWLDFLQKRPQKYSGVENVERREEVKEMLEDLNTAMLDGTSPMQKDIEQLTEWFDWKKEPDGFKKAIADFI